MNLHSSLRAGLFGLSSLFALCAHAAEEVSPVEVVSAIEATFGAHAGQRRNHIKGVCFTGEFVGSRAMRPYSSSALFSGERVAVIGRFSLSGGNPKAPDTARSGRGMALQFRLPDGQIHQMAMLNTPVFGAARPQTFLDLMRATQPDPQTGKPDPEKIRAFKATHPDNLAQADFLASNNPPASYAESAYWGIHTFHFINSKQQTTPVRWRFLPEDGERRLNEAELQNAGGNFLESAIIERTRKGPVRWQMRVTLGQPGDVENDPTVLWPSERREVDAGTLTITAAMPQAGAACEAINFDPMVMAPGIAPSQDPILRFRSPSYAVSFARRLSGQ